MRLYNNNFRIYNMSGHKDNILASGLEYVCVRCGTTVTSEELNQLPEIKCICGFRVLQKIRPNTVKQVKAI
jgi:DNA-directed RNA polymerase subunit P|tara:strand:- start:118 stop:330 length:213 start_codon:yes stop_codon:yes gene_type:complete